MIYNNDCEDYNEDKYIIFVSSDRSSYSDRGLFIIYRFFSHFLSFSLFSLFFSLFISFFSIGFLLSERTPGVSLVIFILQPQEKNCTILSWSSRWSARPHCMHKWIGKRYLHCLEIPLDPENPCTLPRARFPSRPLLFGQNPMIWTKP